MHSHKRSYSIILRVDYKISISQVPSLSVNYCTSQVGQMKQFINRLISLLLRYVISRRTSRSELAKNDSKKIYLDASSVQLYNFQRVSNRFRESNTKV